MKKISKKRRNPISSKSDLTSAMKKHLEKNPGRVINYRQMSKLLGISDREGRRKVAQILVEFSKNGIVDQIELGRFKIKSVGNTIEGIVKYHGTKPFFYSDSINLECVPIDGHTMHGILNGDRVSVVPSNKNKKEPIVYIVDLIKRSEKIYTGILESIESNFFFLSKDKSLKNDVFIPKSRSHGANAGQIVAIKIVSWDLKDKNPEGEVLYILGESGDNDAEMNSILIEYGLPYDYPKVVADAADKLTGNINDYDISLRRDYRDIPTMTIDPIDAKDFDDALSIRRIDDDNVEVGVHIADVSHFVKQGDMIDAEAYKRATSIYLVDRTIPMLPERLCNDLCSLRPKEDKFAYSCTFVINEHTAEVVSYDIHRSIIRSDIRFSYEDAQNIIENEDGLFAKELKVLNEIAKKIRAKRFSKGSIAFDRKEIKFILDESGHPINTYLKESKDSHKLVEEYMLLANKTVAEHISKKCPKKTFIYRVHDKPDADKISNLSRMAKQFGHNFNDKVDDRNISQQINILLSEIKDKPEDNLLSTIAIRSMAKAVYTTNNIGHYGLAFDEYTHFTSPIRRYPDLMVHRLLTSYLEENAHSVDAQEYEEYCEHSSKMEELASAAERASIKYKQVEYMKDKIGYIYNGVISGVTDWGIYLIIEETHCEGMISIDSIADDFYFLDNEHYCLIGEKTKRKFTLGDKIKVKIISANLDKKQLDCELV